MIITQSVLDSVPQEKVRYVRPTQCTYYPNNTLSLTNVRRANSHVFQSFPKQETDKQHVSPGAII